MRKSIIVITRVFEPTTPEEKEKLLNNNEWRLFTNGEQCCGSEGYLEPENLTGLENHSVVLIVEGNPDSLSARSKNNELVEKVVSTMSISRLSNTALICHPGCSTNIQEIFKIIPSLARIPAIGIYSVNSGMGEFNTLLGYVHNIETAMDEVGFDEAVEALFNYILVVSKQRLVDDFRHLTHYLANKLSFIRISLQLKIQDPTSRFDEDADILVKQIYSHIVGQGAASGLCGHGFSSLLGLARLPQFSKIEGLEEKIELLARHIGIFLTKPETESYISDQSELGLLLQKLARNDEIFSSDLSLFDAWFSKYKELLSGVKDLLIRTE